MLRAASEQLSSEVCSEAEILELTVEANLLRSNLYLQQGHFARRYESLRLTEINFIWLCCAFFLLHLAMHLQRGGGPLLTGAAADVSGNHEPIQ